MAFSNLVSVVQCDNYRSLRLGALENFGKDTVEQTEDHKYRIQNNDL